MSRTESVAALLDAGVAAQQAGRADEARKLFEKVLRSDARNPAALHFLAMHHLKAGELEPGLQLIRRMIAYHPNDAGAHNNLGNALSWADRPAEAISAYDRAIALRPGYVAAYIHRGMARAALGDAEGGAADYRAGLARDPSDPGAWRRLAMVLDHLRQPQEALAAFEQLLNRAPPSAEAWFGRGKQLRRLERLEEALADYARALALDPAYVPALIGRGNALRELRRMDEALASLEAAIRLEPDLAEAHEGRGHVLVETGRFEEALAEYDRVLELAPHHAQAWGNRGTAYQDTGRLDLAMADYRKAIEIDPADDELQMNLGFLLLLQGEYERGFELHERRWGSAQGRGRDRRLAQPLWLGEPDPAGKSILLYSDQGFGDALQFCRYAPLVARRGGRVILEVQPALVRLLSNLPGIETVIPWGAPQPPFELQCPLASLPRAFGTTLQTIPPAPYPEIPPERAQAWRPWMGARAAPRIGFAWSGSHANKVNVHRLVDQQALLAAMPPGAELHNLQVELNAGEEAVLERAGVRRPDREIIDFADTAGLFAHLDLVVTVDTSLAHLAGALGREAFVLLHHAPDWRWGMTGEDSPWYPSLRLFRQERPADWSGALAKLKLALAEWMAAR